jgi:nucleoside-diphosphate-sugar epimerase/predicted glycosyltransferase
LRALVTGCAGFIGSHLSESLLADGHSVVGIDCFTDNYERSRKLANLEVARQWNAFELAPVDLAAADLDGFLDDCDAVFHLAGEPGVRSSWDERFELFLRRNVMATQRLLESASRAPEKPFVFASSSSIYGDSETLPTTEDAPAHPLSPYGASKLAAENLCRIYHANHGVCTVALRYFTVYGPRQRPDMAFNRFCRAAIDGDPLTVFGDGRQTRDFTFVQDIVQATRAAAETPAAAGRAFNVGGGSRVSVREAVALLEDFAGRPLDVRYEDSQRGDVRHTGADTERARTELGFRPLTSFDRGLRAEFDWMRDLRGRGRRSARPAAAVASAPIRRRFLFHSNEIVGLGHLRRALAVSAGLGTGEVGASSLILTGSPIAPFFELPPGVDTVKLPARARDADGAARSGALGVDVDDLEELRSSIALAATEAFAPDVVVVDKVPLGLNGELGPALRSLSADSSSKVVLGLRDIDDSPARVRLKWPLELRDAIESYFDAVLVYGPRSSPDALECLGWDDLGVPVHHVGYLGLPMPATGPDDLPEDYLLATAGGGHDGVELLEAFARAIRIDPLPHPAVIVPGPLMDAAQVARLRKLTHGLDAEVHAFRTDMERVIAGARGVVSMAGYNTVAELMRARKPALLVPRVRPSEEQLVRAQNLASRGLQEMLHPDSLTGSAMRRALDRLLARPAPTLSAADYRGSERTAEILRELAGVREPVDVPEPEAAVALQAANVAP